MGAFAFEGAPSYMLLNQRRAFAAEAAGVVRGWDVPVVAWHTPDGFDTFGESERGVFPHHTLTFSLSGPSGPRVEALVGRRRLVQPDSDAVTLHHAGLENGFRAAGDIRFAHIYFTDGFARRIGAELYGSVGDREGLLLREGLVFFSDPELRRIAGDYVARALDATEPPTALEMDSRANLLGLRLVGWHSILAPSARVRARRGGLAPWRLRRATEWLEARMAEDARLADLAAAVGLSERHLCTAFRVSTGRPPHQWLLDRRVERAKGLLAADPARPVTEVALACGFTSSAHFATVFRRATGKTPSAWRHAGAR